MWWSKQWVGRAVGTAVLAMVSGLPVGWAEPSVAQVPGGVEVFEGREPQAGVSWSAVRDTGQSVKRQPRRWGSQSFGADWQATPSTAWLDLHGGQSRAANREHAYWRHEF